MFDIYIDIDNQKPIDAISIVDNTRIPMTKNLIDAIFDVYIDIENQKQNRCDFDSRHSIYTSNVSLSISKVNLHLSISMVNNTVVPWSQWRAQAEISCPAGTEVGKACLLYTSPSPRD